MIRRFWLVLFLGISFTSFCQDLSSVRQKIDQIQANADFKLRDADSLIAPRMDLSSQGGQAIAFTSKQELFLIHEELLGEAGRIDRSFYFDNGKLIAVVDVTTSYSENLNPENAIKTSEKYLFYNQRLDYYIDRNGQLFSGQARGDDRNGEQLVKYVTDLRNELFPSTIPNIQLKNEFGEIINSSDLLQNGKPKVFVFWSRYCAPCKLEMKGMTNIGKDWYEQYDAEIVFVSLAEYDSLPYESDIVSFLSSWEQEEGVYFLHDNQRQLYQALGSEAFPSTVLFTKTGELYRQWDYYDDGLERSVGLYFKKLWQESL